MGFYRIAYYKEPGWFLLHFMKPAMTFVGFESLDRHPPLSPSVHDHHLASHTQRPLLSLYTKPPSSRGLLSSNPDASSFWTRSFGLRFMTPLHPPLLPTNTPSGTDRNSLRDKENTSHGLNLLLHTRNWNRMNVSSRVWFWVEERAVDLRKLQPGSDEPGSDTIRFLKRSLLLLCVCVWGKTSLDSWFGRERNLMKQ